MLLKTTFRKLLEGFYLRQFYFILLIILTFATIQIQPQNGWSKKAKIITRRCVISAGVVDNKIYVIGGYTSVDNNLSVNEVYDPLTDTCEVRKQMPTPRDFLSTAVVDGIIYTIGGNHNTGGSKTVEAYDPQTDTWTTKQNCLHPIFGASACVVDGIIYLVGGNHTESYCYAYDPKTDSWTMKTAIPETQGGIIVTAYNNLVYAFGGGYSHCYSTLFSYDPKTDTWTKRKDMPTARATLQTCLINDKIYALGGYYSIWGGISSAVEVYDPATDSWETLPDMPFKNTMFAAGVVEDKIYMIGGTPDWAILIPEVWEYTPPSIFAKQPFIDKVYAKINTDSVLFRTRFSNSQNLQFTSNLIVTNSDTSQVDSVSLYDDGMHGDSLSNDGLYGAYIPPQTTEDFYTLSVSITENQTQNYRITNNECKFTTAGPVKLDSLSFTKGILSSRVKPYVHNWGNTKTIPKVSMKLTSNDPWLKYNEQIISIPDIPSGTTVASNSSFIFQVVDSIFPGYFNFKAEIMSDGLVFWEDSTKMILTGIKDEVQQPLTFKLEQNYPNPFNPTTKISWQSPVSSRQVLKVFDVLGNEVATLVDEYTPAGNYEVEFDGSKLTSGVYFYQLKAGSFIEVKKMILLR